MRPTRPSPNHVWISTFAEYDADGTLLREEGYWYKGPVARATEMNPRFDQVNFRVRSDTNTADGGTPTWISTENQATNIVIDVDTTFRVRFVVQNDGTANTNDTLSLYAAKNGGAYTIVSTARNDGLKSADASTDADSTSIATGNFVLTAGAGTAAAGVYDESGSETLVVNSDTYTEIEFGLTIDSAQVNDGDYFDLRIYSDADGGALTAFTDMTSPGTYDNVPRIEANEGTPPVTASGTATLTAVTSSGAVQTILGASGSPALTEITASGAVQTILGANGTPSIAEITSSGLVGHINEASGTPELTGPTSSGNVDTTASSVDASGNATLAEITASGTAGYEVTATSSATLAAMTASGEAHKAPKVYLNTTPVFNGSEVEMTVTAWNEAGTSITFNDAPGDPTGSVYLAVENRESGDFDWIPVTVNTGVKSASGSPTLTEITASGTVVTEIGAYGTPTLAEITASGTAGYLVDATGTPTLTALTASGSVTTTSAVEASGSATLGEITASGTVETILGAYGTATLTELTASGTAGYVITATGTAELTAITASGNVSLEGQVNASGNATLTAMTAAGTVETILGAYGTATLSEITASGTVETTTLEDVLASGTPTLSEVTASGAVQTINGAYGTATLSEMVASGTIVTEIGAYGTPTLEALTASGLVGKVIEASGTPQLAAFTSSGLCTVPGLSLAAQVFELTAVFEPTKAMTAIFDPDKAVTATYDYDKAMTAKADSLDG